MVLYKDIFDDEEPVNVDNEFFYVMVDTTEEPHPVPTYVFPNFLRFYNMMTLMELVHPRAWKVGRIPVKGNTFSARLPYLKRFLNRQEESLKEYEKDFKNDRRPSDQLTEKELKALEFKIFGYRGL